MAEYYHRLKKEQAWDEVLATSHAFVYSIVLCGRLCFVIGGLFLNRRLDCRLFRLFLIEELQSEGNDLGVILRFALVLVLVGPESPLEVNEAALLEVLLGDLAQLAPGLHVHPLGRFLAFAVALPALGNAQAEVSHLLAAGCEAALRVLA